MMTPREYDLVTALATAVRELLLVGPASPTLVEVRHDLEDKLIAADKEREGRR